MKIIYIFEVNRFYESDEERHQLDVFRNQGHEIEVWSTTKWIFPQVSENFRNNDSETFVHYINNEQDFSTNLARVKGQDCYFIIYSCYYFGKITFAIRKHIKKSGFDYLTIYMAVPLSSFFLSKRKWGRVAIYLERCFKETFHPLYALIRALFDIDYRSRVKQLLENDMYRLLSTFMYRGGV